RQSCTTPCCFHECKELAMPPNAQVKPHRAAGWGRWQALSAAWPGPWNDVGLNAMLGRARLKHRVCNELIQTAHVYAFVEVDLDVPRPGPKLNLRVEVEYSMSVLRRPHVD